MPSSAITVPPPSSSMSAISPTADMRSRLQSRAAVMQNQAELLDIAEDAIMVRDLDERIIFWNRGAQERYGWTKEQALGRVVHDLLHTESALPFEKLKADLFAKGSLTVELTHVTRGGTRIVVESRWTVRRGRLGKPLAIMEINSDITQRKRTEKVLQTAKEELELRVAERTAELRGANERLSLELERRNRIQEMLRKAAERYRNLFYNSPMGIYRTNPNGRILMANPSLFRMLGYLPPIRWPHSSKTRGSTSRPISGKGFSTASVATAGCGASKPPGRGMMDQPYLFGKTRK